MAKSRLIVPSLLFSVAVMLAACGNSPSNGNQGGKDGGGNGGSSSPAGTGGIAGGDGTRDAGQPDSAVGSGTGTLRDASSVDSLDGGGGGGLPQQCLTSFVNPFAALTPYWANWSNSTCGSAVASNGNLVLTQNEPCGTASPDVIEGLTQPYVLCGDFDVQVGYALTGFGAAPVGGMFASLRVDDPAAPLTGMTMERYVASYLPSSNSYQNYKSYTDNSGNDATSVLLATSDTTGRLRITRSGTTVTSYYWKVGTTDAGTGQWVLVKTAVLTSTPWVVLLYEGDNSAASSGPASYSVTFSSLQVTSPGPTDAGTGNGPLADAGASDARDTAVAADAAGGSDTRPDAGAGGASGADTGSVDTSESCATGPGLWTMKAPLMTARYAQGTAVQNGILYVFGGCTGGTCSTGDPVTSTVEAYDPVSNTWSPRGPMPTAYEPGAAVALGGMIYLIGGDLNMNLESAVATLEAYDPVADTWTAKAPLSAPHDSPAAGAIGGKLYVTGQWGGPTYEVTPGLLEIYDPTTNAWTVGAPMPTDRGSAGYGVIDGKLYVAGGIGTNRALLTTLEVYDPASNSWSTKAPMPAAIDSPASAVIGGKLYLVGGTSVSSTSTWVIYDKLYIYDPMQDSWSTGPSKPTPSYGFGAAVGNQLFVPGGYTATGVTNALWVFTPPCVTPLGDGGS